VDTEGARALAERIACGPPREGANEPAPRRSPDGAKRIEVVYVKQRPGRRREVRTYVQRPDGRLERSDR